MRHLTLTPETTMTDERMAVIELIEKGADGISAATVAGYAVIVAIRIGW